MKIRLTTLIAAIIASAICGMAQGISIEGPTTCYVMHSSGKHLAKGSDGHAVLEASTVATPQMLTLTPNANGSVSISTADGQVLTLVEKWNTYFLDTADGTKSEFNIVETGNFIRLQCRNNSKFLGTDDNNAGSRVFSDKAGNDSKHYWYLAADPKAEPKTESVSYLVNPRAERQMFDGWGVSLCWWANMCGKWSDEKIDEIVDWLVSPDGLNFQYFRYNIGGGDDPDHKNCTLHHMGNGKGLRAEMEGFKDSSDGEYIWTRDEAQRKIMLKIKEKRPDAVFEAFSNSAPWYMTYSGCVSGNTDASKDNLKPEYYEEFAHYLVDVCKHYKDEYGIEFRTLEPFNEPVTNYWGANGGQEGCHFSTNAQIAFLKVLNPILQESGLSTVISASDETSVAQSVTDYEAYRKAGILDMVGQWNAHTYTADNNARAKISSLCTEDNMPLWMSEVGAGGSGIGGNLSLAQKLIDDMRYIMPSAWIDWQYIEEGNDQWCLVKANSFAQGTYQKVKNYYVRSHFSRFIKNGYTILTSLNAQTLAARNPEGTEIVLVAINNGSAAIEHIVDLSMYETVGSDIEAYLTTSDVNMGDFADISVESKKVSFKLPAGSIATLVIPATGQNVAEAGIVDGGQYIICPRISASTVLDAANGKVVISDFNDSESQIWTLRATGSAYTFTNSKGDIITRDGNNYALVTKPETTGGQNFLIEKANGMFHKILEPAGVKGFDLEGEKSTSGTGVGIWTYADSAPVHRHWMFMPYASSTPTSIETVTGGSLDGTVVTILPGIGHVTVDTGSDIPANVFVFNTSGVCVYNHSNARGVIDIPLSSGLHVVSCNGVSKTIMVR